MKYQKITKYKYRLSEDIKVELPHAFIFCESKWCRVNGNILHVVKGYCWDGFTCSPDIKKALLASLVHDVLYQMLKYEKIPLTDSNRKKADDCLLRIMLEKKVNKLICTLYYTAVRKFGGKALKLGKSPEVIEL